MSRALEAHIDNVQVCKEGCKVLTNIVANNCTCICCTHTHTRSNRLALHTLFLCFPSFFSFFFPGDNKAAAGRDGTTYTVLNVLATHTGDKSVVALAVKTLKSFMRGAPENAERIRIAIVGNSALEPFANRVFD